MLAHFAKDYIAAAVAVVVVVVVVVGTQNHSANYNLPCVNNQKTRDQQHSMNLTKNLITVELR